MPRQPRQQTLRHWLQHSPKEPTAKKSEGATTMTGKHDAGAGKDASAKVGDAPVKDKPNKAPAAKDAADVNGSDKDDETKGGD